MDSRGGGGGPARFPGLPRRGLYRAGQPPAGWPLERPPLLAEASMPGESAAGNVRHRPVKPVASATDQSAIAIQLLHEYLQAPDSGCHPQRWRPINRGLPAVVLPVGQAPGLRRQVPGTARARTSASGGGSGMSDRRPAPGDAGGQRGREPDLPATGEFAKMRAVMRASARHRDGGADPELEVADADPGPDT